MSIPTIPAVTPGFDYLNLISNIAPYVISTQFVSLTNFCPFATIALETVAGGTVADFTSTDGITMVSLLSNYLAADI
mgnify:CR=1 FL=1